MGKKLSEEIEEFMKENCPGPQLGRLSFIGHSLGGLIIRAAIPYLEKYKLKFHGFMTLCTPHLGCMFSQSKLLSTGIWVLKNLKKSHVLDQLMMSDTADPKESVLFKLSMTSRFDSFKHVVLVSSQQD